MGKKNLPALCGRLMRSLLQIGYFDHTAALEVHHTHGEMQSKYPYLPHGTHGQFCEKLPLDIARTDCGKDNDFEMFAKSDHLFCNDPLH